MSTLTGPDSPTSFPDERGIQHAILRALDGKRRAGHDERPGNPPIGVDALCAELGIARRDYRAAARRLLDRGAIRQGGWGSATIETGEIYITEAGIQALEAFERRSASETSVQDSSRVDLVPPRTVPTPQGAASPGQVRAMIEEHAASARAGHPSLAISDEELRRRCADLLGAGGDYDRAVDQACRVLETRVRAAAGNPRDRNGRDLIGTSLMQEAFRPERPLLRLSADPSEQQGAMELYRGTMAFFRNRTGHNVTDAYDRDEASRVVVWVDQLLLMLGRATRTAPEEGADDVP